MLNVNGPLTPDPSPPEYRGRGEKERAPGAQLAGCPATIRRIFRGWHFLPLRMAGMNKMEESEARRRPQPGRRALDRLARPPRMRNRAVMTQTFATRWNLDAVEAAYHQ